MGDHKELGLPSLSLPEQTCTFTQVIKQDLQEIATVGPFSLVHPRPLAPPFDKTLSTKRRMVLRGPIEQFDYNFELRHLNR